MRILLLGEFSNVHHTLALGLRTLGHEVCVASNGDGWKDYPRDVDLKRHSLGRWDTLRYYWRLHRAFKAFRGYDVVQIINPVFLDLKAERIYPYWERLRRDNKRVFMGAFGMDHYWVKAGVDCHTFKYSDFNFGSVVRREGENATFIADWLHGEKGKLNRYIAQQCDGIIAGLYEYDASYRPYYAHKLRFIPFPIDWRQLAHVSPPEDGKVHFFIGIQRLRSAYKGTDIMLRALQRVVATYPERCAMYRAESVPYDTYVQQLQCAHVLLDQLYSYTPAMNALMAMAKGLVVLTGAEPENYDILHEEVLRPIVHVEPTEQSVYEQLEYLVLHPHCIPLLSAQSRAYIHKHHDHLKVAQAYVDYWNETPTTQGARREC